MKFKKILSSFLAFAVAFGAVSFAPFGNNGSFLNSAIVAEAKTENSATKMSNSIQVGARQRLSQPKSN